MKKWAKIMLLAIVASSGLEVSAGSPTPDQGPEIWVDGPADMRIGETPLAPDAAADYRGRQLYVWEDNPTADDSGLDVFLRIYDKDGTSLTGPVTVNTLTADNQRFPRIAVAPDGSFLVAWESFEPVSEGVFNPKIRSQAFDSDGQPMGTERELSTLLTDSQAEVHLGVGALEGGGFVAVWESWNSADPMDTSYSIQGRRMGADGVPIGGQFQVNSLMTGTLEQYPAVTGLADGGFLATWSSPQIQGRRFMANGMPMGNDFQINTFQNVSFRDQPDVAMAGDGRVMVVWRDDEGPGNTEIRGRIYASDLSPLGDDFRINTVTNDAQTIPQVAGFGAAGFFVVWQSASSSGPDAEPTSIEGRLVSEPGVFGGPQFLVNLYTLNSQEDPSIGGRDGFVAIAWMSRQNAEVMGQVIMGQLWNICGIFCDGFE